jgi:hypothetical protein
MNEPTDWPCTCEHERTDHDGDGVCLVFGCKCPIYEVDVIDPDANYAIYEEA